MRTLIVSRGWQARASIMPAPPPAIRFVAALAGFFWPSPLMLLADILEEFWDLAQGQEGASDLSGAGGPGEGEAGFFAKRSSEAVVVLCLVFWNVLDQERFSFFSRRSGTFDA